MPTEYVVTVPDWVEYDELWSAVKGVVGRNPMSIIKVKKDGGE